MPVPKPKKDELKQKFISRCIGQLSNEDPDTSPEQIQAICFDAWKNKGENLTDENLTDENMTDENLTDENMTDENLTDENSNETIEEEVRRDEDGHIIVAENVKIVFGGYIQEMVKKE